MKRRAFLQAVAAVGVAPLVPSAAVVDQPMTATKIACLTEEFVREFSRNVMQRIDIAGAPWVLHYVKTAGDDDYFEVAYEHHGEIAEGDLGRYDAAARLAFSRAGV